MSSPTPPSPWHTFAVAYAVALQRSGASAGTVEDEVARVVGGKGVPVTVMATPTALWLDVEGPRLLRVEPGRIHLGRQAELVEVGNRVVDGLDPLAATAEIQRIEARPAPWSPDVERLAYMVSAGTAALTLGGNVTDALCGAIIGLAAHTTTTFTRSAPRWERLTDLSSAFTAGAAAQLLAVMGSDPARTALAAVVPLAPGLALTVAAAETASGHWTSGTTRFGGALASVVQLGAGLALAAAIVPRLEPVLVAVPGTYTIRVVAALVIPIALAMLGRTRAGDVPLAAFTAYVATAVARAFTGTAGALLGAVTATALANTIGRFRGVPPAVYQSPALYLLVPGSVGVSALRAAIAGSGESEAAWSVASVVIGLAAGILVGHAIVPPAVTKSDRWTLPVGRVRKDEGGVVNRRNVVFLTTVLIGVLIDQVTKIQVAALVQARGDIPIIENWFSLSYAENTGAAFSTMEGQIPLFLVFTAFALIVTVDLVRRFEPTTRYVPFVLGMILAGALGNGIDRLRQGFVIDFRKVYAGTDPLKSWFIERVHTNVWPIFNVADSLLVVGVTLFVAHFLLQRDHEVADLAEEAPTEAG
jgi:lipoprotein signal peptidase